MDPLGLNDVSFSRIWIIPFGTITLEDIDLIGDTIRLLDKEKDIPESLKVL